MDRILRQRDRLLQVTARLVGLASTAVAVLLLVLPGQLAPGLTMIALPLIVVLAAAQFRMGMTKALAWPLVVVVAGLALIVLLRVESTGALDALAGVAPHPHRAGLLPGVGDAMRVIAAGSIGAATVLLTINLARMLVLVGLFAATMITVVCVFLGTGLLALATLSTIAGWVGLVAAGSVLSAGLLQAARRISSIGRAHRNERQASETEAQRRQGARLLHDTVLATLTLLAHSGVGVSTGALQRQAGDDARLLRQLRLSSAPISGSVATDESPDPEAVKADPLAQVKKRFARLGLTVSWHGAETVSLPAKRQTAFLLALGECLENVRRHSGVGEAHVTLTDDESTVRALITDNGVGFLPEEVGSERLGYQESVVERLREVGGNARVFSARGAGTTVVLEVPR